MSDKAAEWLTRAQADLTAAELLHRFDEYPTAILAFHCQQAVEKSLKAFQFSALAEASRLTSFWVDLKPLEELPPLSSFTLLPSS